MFYLHSNLVLKFENQTNRLKIKYHLSINAQYFIVNRQKNDKKSLQIQLKR